MPASNVFVLSFNSVYEYDESDSVKVFATRETAISAYDEAVSNAQDSCLNDGHLPEDITDVDIPDDQIYEGKYVKEVYISKSNILNLETKIYMYQEYAMDHVIIKLREIALEGVIQSNFFKRTKI